MAWGKTNIGGGGSSLNKSVIVITAPTGSTVTASMGGKTKRAKEENGTWTFTGLDFGEWTITATLLDKKREIVVIIDKLTVEYRTISYGMWIYKNGDQCKDNSGGWSGYRGSVSIKPTGIVMSGYSQFSILGAGNTFDFSKYKSINVKVEEFSGGDYRDRLYLAGSYSESHGSISMSPAVQITSAGTFSLDTSQINSKTRVFIEKYSDGYMTVKEVWFDYE